MTLLTKLLLLFGPFFVTICRGEDIAASTALIFKNGVSQINTLSEAIKFVQQGKLQKLEDTMKELKESIQKQKLDHENELTNIKIESNRKKDSILAKIENAKQKAKNQVTLVNFMKQYIPNDDLKYDECMEEVMSSNDRLETVSNERISFQKNNQMNMEESYKQIEVIRSQETEKAALKEKLKSLTAETKLININAENSDAFPQYAKFLMKSIKDQEKTLADYSKNFDTKQKTELNMELISEELHGLNLTFESDSDHWELLKTSGRVITQQFNNLKSLTPIFEIITSAVPGVYKYEMDADGELLPVAPCQCIPTPQGGGVIPSQLTYSCPLDTVLAHSLEDSMTIECKEAMCPEELDKAKCGNFSELPWSDWVPCDEIPPKCLMKAYRTRKIRDVTGTISYETELEADPKNPLIFGEIKGTLTASMAGHEYYLPAGIKLGIFLVGGGGGADDSYSGSSGFFTYEEVEITESGNYNFTMEIGKGGDYSDGGDTWLEIGGLWNGSAKGGGGLRRPGWSGGSSEKGGENGGDGMDENNGSKEKLPEPCSPLVTLEPGKTGDYDNDGTGGGGVIINGLKPVQKWKRDGLGFGAGGGEDNYDGYDGVAVVMICQ